MNLFAVRFHDKPDKLATRSQFLQAHLDWLNIHKNTILVAGSLRLSPDQGAIGGLWIVQAEEKNQIEQLLVEDPFWKAGLRERVEISFWSKAFPDRMTLI
ncbi:YciI family protein [Undibacterium sp. Jales W-56]|uniref:YciI family protein n=1 Tax=Undibacterium sp. Jales W-56 TaxID=2897325 RepID=UPI0021D14256|nr:YciI family protein [Undibacterium sp. Jales W-56]MCU6433719.1 YciI family protein [Undibacterium sp. Jales W-56]